MSRNFDFSQAAGNGVTILPDLIAQPANPGDVVGVTAVSASGQAQLGFIPVSGTGTVTQIDTTGPGISGGPITGAGTLVVQWNAGQVTAIGAGLTLAGGTLSAPGSPPTGAAGGDLGGSYPNPSVQRLMGNPIAPSAISDTTIANNITSGTLAAARLPTSPVAPGPYTNANITVDATGRVTAAANGSVPQPSTTNPLVEGIANPGVALTYARADHVHPASATGGGSSVTVSDTPPASPKGGDMWWDSVGTQLYLYYTDPSTSQWVNASNAGLAEAPLDSSTYGRSGRAWVVIPPPVAPAVSAPLMSAATAQVGTAVTYARGDHVHPSDTSRITQAQGDARYLQLIGGTVSGGITVHNPGTSAVFIADTTSGNNRGLMGNTNGLLRWWVAAGDNTAETGGNTGSNFGIYRYDDGGNWLGTPLSINRSTGNINTGGTLNIAGNVYFGGDANTGYGMWIEGGTSNRMLGYNNGGNYDYWQASTGNRNWTGNAGGLLVLMVTNLGNMTLGGATAWKVGGGAWADSSDLRIKTVTGDYSTGLDALRALKPIRYVLKGNWKRRHQPLERGADLVTDDLSPHALAATDQTEFVGLVAQDAELCMPELVSRHPAVIDDENVDDLRSLDPSALTYAMINAIKTLADRLEALEAQRHGV